MFISELALKNWRNFRTVSIVLTPRTFIIGPNAAGKSNLLDSIRFLRDIAKAGGGLQKSISERGGLPKIRCLAAPRNPDVEVDVTLSDSDSTPVWRYAVGITQQARRHRRPVLRYERVWKSGSLILERPDADDRSDEERLTQTHLEQINANSAFREIVRFLESIRYLHLVPQLLRRPEVFQGSTSMEDPYGRNFLELIANTPEKLRKSRLRAIESLLRVAVPQLKDLTDMKDESGIPHLEAEYEHWRPNAGRQREDQFSDGTMRLIGLFWSLLEGDAPLLLEEPELSLNSAIIARLPGLFARVQRKRRRQLLVSTHSYDLLSEKGIGGEEVVILKPNPEGTTAELASDNKEVRVQLEAGMSAADAALPHIAPPQAAQLDLLQSW